MEVLETDCSTLQLIEGLDAMAAARVWLVVLAIGGGPVGYCHDR